MCCATRRNPRCPRRSAPPPDQATVETLKRPPEGSGGRFRFGPQAAIDGVRYGWEADLSAEQNESGSRIASHALKLGKIGLFRGPDAEGREAFCVLEDKGNFAGPAGTASLNRIPKRREIATEKIWSLWRNGVNLTLPEFIRCSDA